MTTKESLKLKECTLSLNEGFPTLLIPVLLHWDGWMKASPTGNSPWTSLQCWTPSEEIATSSLRKLWPDTKGTLYWLHEHIGAGQKVEITNSFCKSHMHVNQHLTVSHIKPHLKVRRSRRWRSRTHGAIWKVGRGRGHAVDDHRFFSLVFHAHTPEYFTHTTAFRIVLGGNWAMFGEN